MKIILERHAYAPELNKAHIVHNGSIRAVMPAPGCASIKAARAFLFAPLKYRGRYVTLRAENAPEHATYNRARHGFCNDMRSLAGALKVFRAYHNLPGCAHIVKTQLIG